MASRCPASGIRAAPLRGDIGQSGRVPGRRHDKERQEGDKTYATFVACAACVLFIPAAAQMIGLQAVHGSVRRTISVTFQTAQLEKILILFTILLPVSAIMTGEGEEAQKSCWRSDI